MQNDERARPQIGRAFATIAYAIVPAVLLLAALIAAFG